jgi:hypothetical protein
LDFCSALLSVDGAPLVNTYYLYEGFYYYAVFN